MNKKIKELQEELIGTKQLLEVRMVYVHEMKLYRDRLKEHNNKK